ncbi:MAG: GAF domain-containing protein [Clostridiaceae bacterium]|jgi:L-methionine (R)-S-oxide reductase|nr:GAF domain-containing protein [Clostridiaceae bacterium]
MEKQSLYPSEKETLYPLLEAQLRSMSEGEAPITAASNAAALLYHALPQINWAGFYLTSGDQLILGPFQGKPACSRIGWNKGVCGAAWAQDAVQRVADVHAFPGHIACDGDSRSEIVLPLHAQGRVAALLDIDSPIENRFDQADQQGLEQFARALEQCCDWLALAPAAVR